MVLFFPKLKCTGRKAAGIGFPEEMCLSRAVWLRPVLGLELGRSWELLTLPLSAASHVPQLQAPGLDLPGAQQHLAAAGLAGVHCLKTQRGSSAGAEAKRRMVQQPKCREFMCSLENSLILLSSSLSSL